MGVKAIYFNVQDVGKHVKKSKKRFIWKFQIDRNEHVLEMFVSYLSGKKQIILNGRSIYEVQKVTSSFQYPFQIENNYCMIVQHGDQFELRINNQVFSHLYNQEKMKREFQFEGDSTNDPHEDGFGSKNKYGGGGGSNEPDYSSQRHHASVGTKIKEWRKEEYEKAPVRKDDSDEEPPGFADVFNKFDYKANQQPKKEDPFESYNNKYSEPKARASVPNRNAFDQFEKPKQASAFGQFDSPPKPQTSFQKPGASAFDQFNSPPKQQQQQFGGFDAFNQKPPAKTQQQPSANAQDLLGLDFGGGNQNQQRAPQNAGGFDDFFNQPQPSGPGMNQSQNTMQQQQRQSSQGMQHHDNHFGDLMGLDFGSQPGNMQQPQNQRQASAPLDMLDSGPQMPQNQPQMQAQKKQDLWNTDLVSLDPNEAFNNNKRATSQPGYDYGNIMGYGGYNNAPGYGNQGYGGNAGGYGQGMNTYQTGGYGGGMNPYGGNQAMGGYGQQTGGGMNQGYGNQGYGMAGQNNVNMGYQGGNAGNEATPFDFDM